MFAKGGSTNVRIEYNKIHNVDVDGITIGGWSTASSLIKPSDNEVVFDEYEEDLELDFSTLQETSPDNDGELLSGGIGNDVLTGGTGRDDFVFRGALVSSGSGQDAATDSDALSITPRDVVEFIF